MRGKEGIQGWDSRLLEKFRHGPKNPHLPKAREPLGQGSVLGTAVHYYAKHVAASQCRQETLSSGASCLG